MSERTSGSALMILAPEICRVSGEEGVLTMSSSSMVGRKSLDPRLGVASIPSGKISLSLGLADIGGEGDSSKIVSIRRL